VGLKRKNKESSNLGTQKKRRCGGRQEEIKGKELIAKGHEGIKALGVSTHATKMRTMDRVTKNQQTKPTPNSENERQNRKKEAGQMY